jgi:hypothetical protein
MEDDEVARVAASPEPRRSTGGPRISASARRSSSGGSRASFVTARASSATSSASAQAPLPPPPPPEEASSPRADVPQFSDWDMPADGGEQLVDAPGDEAYLWRASVLNLPSEKARRGGSSGAATPRASFAGTQPLLEGDEEGEEEQQPGSARSLAHGHTPRAARSSQGGACFAVAEEDAGAVVDACVDELADEAADAALDEELAEALGAWEPPEGAEDDAEDEAPRDADEGADASPPPADPFTSLLSHVAQAARAASGSQVRGHAVPSAHGRTHSRAPHGLGCSAAG